MMSRYFLGAWREMSRRRSRSLWMIVGYAAAACFFIAAVSLLLAARDHARQALLTTGAQFGGFIVDKAGAVEGWKAPQREGFYVFNNPARPFPISVVEELRKSPHARRVAPILCFRLGHGALQTVTVAGFDAGDMESVRFASCSMSEIVEGRALEAGDKGCVLLEHSFAAFKGLRPGQKVDLDDEGRAALVVGILGAGTRPVKADIYMRMEDAVELANAHRTRPIGNEVNLVLVEGADSMTHEMAISEARRVMGPDSAIAGYGCWKPAGKAMGIGLDGMGRIALAVAIFFALWTVLSQAASVNERKRDIAVLKAIGWADGEVISQIAWEALLAALIGGAIGTIAASALLAWPPVELFPAEDISAPRLFRPWLPACGMFISAVFGVAAAILPARAVASVRPAETLRQA